MRINIKHVNLTDTSHSSVPAHNCHPVEKPSVLHQQFHLLFTYYTTNNNDPNSY